MKAPSVTWAGGELAPGLYGRVDLTKYQTGVKRAENFHVAVEGGLYKRWGFYYVAKPKFQDKECKLVPWDIEDNDSYVLEFGDEYIRFIRLGGAVLYPGDHVADPDSDAISVNGYMEVPTTYLESEVEELKFTYANDILYIFHKNHPPAQLRRIGLYDWELVDTDFNPNEAAPTGLAAEWQVFAGDPKIWQAVVDDNPAGDYLEIKKPISYKVSAIMEETGLQTLPSDKVTIQADLGNSRLSALITWDAVAGAREYTIYKGENGVYGFIGTVLADETLEFRDTNFAPSYDVVPIKVFEGFDPDDATQYPRVGEFYKQRMVYAATVKKPQAMWLSRALHFGDLTSSVPLQDDDAIQVALVGNKRHTINHLVQLKKFLAFTVTAEWVIGTAGGEALSAGTIDPVPETAYGSKPNLKPLSIGDRILFVQNISDTIRDMGYEFTSNAYKADDLSRLSRHLFENKTIVSWDYADYPHNAVWCVTDDGQLPTMTYVREHEIWGWSHMTTQGKFLDVVSVTEFNQNATYVQTLRTIDGVPTRFIERSEALFTDRIEDMFLVDCGLTFQDPREFTDLVLAEDTITITLPGHGRSVGDELQIETADFRMRFLVDSIDGDDLTLTAKYNKPLPGADDITVSYGTAYICGDDLSGFIHLAGQSGVVALADGKVVKNITVDEAGEFTIPFQAARVHAGLPYTAEMETLDLDYDRAVGQYNVRAVHEITIRLKNSRGVFLGPSASSRDLEPIPPRNDEDYDEPNAALNGPYTISAHPAWERTAGVIVRSPDPLPCHILNIVPDIEYED